MPFSRGFKSIMHDRIQNDPSFRRALLHEAKEAMASPAKRMNTDEEEVAFVILDDLVDESQATRN